MTQTQNRNETTYKTSSLKIRTFSVITQCLDDQLRNETVMYNNNNNSYIVMNPEKKQCALQHLLRHNFSQPLFDLIISMNHTLNISYTLNVFSVIHNHYQKLRSWLNSGLVIPLNFHIIITNCCQSKNKKKDSERSDECIDFTMIIICRNNASISNFWGGFQWQMKKMCAQKNYFKILKNVIQVWLTIIIKELNFLDIQCNINCKLAETGFPRLLTARGKKSQILCTICKHSVFGNRYLVRNSLLRTLRDDQIS
ncbi:hypothetical protein AGLY_006104 [Aphis glycines]|uniref:Uncharacterized protein n=1 Tax=Aphis glycines TaxID=307491 RepID=A0A6G0TV46_APHGL|nr:hypothetical protein AGLY_006104 [Aphis glycines]